MNKFFIIGGGLTGLSCAYQLIQLEINPKLIYIFEARQEIGSPTRSPGLSLKTENFFNLYENINFKSLSKITLFNEYFIFRREWFEKSILIYLTNLGCNINLKYKVTEQEINKISNDYIIINCAGKKSKSSGFPGDYKDFINNNKKIISKNYEKLIPWYGYLLLNNKNTTNNKNTICIKKSENLFELWTNNKNLINYKQGNIIEIMKSYFPSDLKNIFANKSIDRGFLLAKKALQ